LLFEIAINQVSFQAICNFLCYFNWFVIDYGGRHWVTYYNYKANGQIRTEYWDPLGNDQLFYGLTWPYSIIDSNHWQIMHSRATTCGAHGKKSKKIVEFC
jgi:hypothetical protein